ncbi:MAG: hypothetical protein Q4G66_09755 [bacterium]|nr:hypothetical protein [bacterium]
MQPGYFVPVFLLSLTLCATALADEGLPWERRTPFREGTIHYEMSGTQQGTEILYIKEFGRLRVKQSQSTMELLGKTVSTKTREVTTPEWVVRYNLSDNWGEKNTNPAKLYQQEYEQLSTAEKKVFAANAGKIGPSLFENAGSIVQSRSTTMLGFVCDQVSFGGFSSSCLLHDTDIPLQAEARVMGVINQIKAVRIDLTSPIPDELFNEPAGIPAAVNEDAEAMLRRAIHQAVQILKEPDGINTLQKQARQFLPRMGEDEEEQSKPEQKTPSRLLRRTVR